MTFTSEGSILEWRGEGETLRIEPWGTDSVRIRSSKKMPISEQNWGLLGEHHEPGQAVRVEISEDQSLATLTNGNITVTAHAFKEGNAGAGHTESLCELSFSKADGTELFQEMPQHGALKLHARKFSPTDGGNQRIEATFLSPENEHLYGMGEYQQSYMDLKGCFRTCAPQFPSINPLRGIVSRLRIPLEQPRHRHRRIQQKPHAVGR